MRRLFALVLAMGLLSACGSSSTEPASSAPGFELKDLNGDRVKLESFQGHPILLDFWATWCGPCRMSIPMVQEFYLKNKSRGLVVMGLNVDEDPSNVFRFVKQFKMTYPVLYAGASNVAADYGIQGLPSFIFIDPQGRVTKRFEGFNPEMFDVLQAELERVLTPAH